MKAGKTIATAVAPLMILAATLGMSACAVRPWEGKWDIYYAADADQKIKPGGGAVIWKPGAINTFELRASSVHMAGIKVYKSVANESTTPYWENVQFIRVGSRPLQAPHLKDHPLPVGEWNGKYVKEAAAEIEPIVNSVLTGTVQANTERLVGSFVKDNKVEYFILYRLRDALRDGEKSKDLLIIDLKDPEVEAIKHGGEARENGWGTGGHH